MEKVIIIGSGPAGLTAAIYAARANLSPLVFAGAQPGGQLMITSDVENYPGFSEGILGPDLMDKFRAQAARFGSRIVDVDVTKVDFSGPPLRVYVDDEEHHAETVIAATGASAIWLGLENETKLRGRGVSSCATCDGAFFKNKDIIVVGGGDTAMEEATFLTRFAKTVTVVHRRDTLRASKIMRHRAENHPKISFVYNAVVDDIYGEHRVTGVRLRNTESDAVEDRQCDAVFVAIGHSPNTEIYAGQLHLDARGYIVSKDGTKTNVPGVFVAGDVQDTHYRQAVTAAGLGCRAAMDAERYLEALETATVEARR
jgi:thioredoxin reductase (NADPH)